MEKIKTVCIAGPTASGKTALAVRLAKELGGEIVSADSIQLYRGAHIASAAPDVKEMCGIKHHLIEFLPYGCAFTVYDYLEAARKAVADIHSRGRLPVIAGGTGLYINALLDGIHLEPDTFDDGVRRETEAEYDAAGGAAMLEKLAALDKAAAEKLSPNDRRRIVRALEIYRITGRTKTELDAASKAGSEYDYTLIGLTCAERQTLYNRINTRVDIMMQNGLLEEARAVYDRGNTFSGGAAQAIGHKEFFGYFSGEEPLETAVENLKRSTRRYAKRQLTWFSKRTDINWIYIDKEDTYRRAKAILEKGGYAFEKQ